MYGILLLQTYYVLFLLYILFLMHAQFYEYNFLYTHNSYESSYDFRVITFIPLPILLQLSSLTTLQ